MASLLVNEMACIMYGWGVYEQNNIVNTCLYNWLDNRKDDHCQ